MRITRIESQKRRPGRKNVYIDDRFAFGINDETLIRIGLRTGDEIDRSAIRSIESTEDLASGKKLALRFLAHRARSVHEVRQRLLKHEVEREIVEQIISDLLEARLLDDHEFARMFIRDRLRSRPSGRILMKQKLRMLGIDERKAEGALEEILGSVSQESVAIGAARKFLKSRRGNTKDPLALRRKLAGFLARRGFAWDVITTVLKKVLGKQVAETTE